MKRRSCNRRGHPAKKCPSRNQDKRDICKRCHRTSSETYDLPLVAISENAVHRKYGDKVQQGDEVCMPCYRYTQVNINVSSWSMAWAACLFSLLTSSEQIFHPQQLLGIISISIRNMFKPCIPLLNPNIHALWHEKSKYFMDVTT